MALKQCFIIDVICSFNWSVIIFVLLTSNLKFSSSFDTQKYSKPVLSESSEVIVNSGSNFTVLCQGNSPLNWTTPEVTEGPYADYTKIEVTNVIPYDKNFKYASRLYVKNATFPFVGFYRCFDRDTDSVGGTKLYLYIRDEDHLAVNEKDVDTLIVTQYDEATIPCRPTSPDVTVDLTLITGDKMNATYDPKTGFKFFINSLSDQDSYYCNFLRGSKIHEINYYVLVQQIVDSLPKPVLEERNNGHTVVGETLVLQCKIRSHAHIDIEWKTPNGRPIDSTRMNTSYLKRDPNDAALTYEELTIYKTKLSDNGYYYCIITDNQEHSTNSSVKVKIYDNGEHFLHLYEENGVYSVESRAGEAYVQWKIDVQGHPIPKLSWLNNRNEMVSFKDTSKYEISFTDSEAFLKIKNVEISDYGNYTLLAENGYENISLKLFLNVTDKPSVHIKMDDFQMVNQNASVRCIVAAYPKPTVNMFYKNCQGDECEFKEIKQKSVNEDGLQITSEISIKANQSGYVRCFAENSVGQDEDIKELLVSDVKNGLDIFGFDKSIDVDDSSSEAVIAVGDDLTMTCGASVYNYTDSIGWIHNGSNFYNGDKYTFEKGRTSYTNRLTLSISKVNFTDGGLYRCRVHKKNAKEVFRDIIVNVRNPMKPLINNTNMVKVKEMKLPKPFDVYCKVHGVPKPTIKWFKNNEELSPHGHIKFLDNSQRLIFSYTESKDEALYRCVATNRIGTTSREMNLKFTNKPKQFYEWLIYVIAILLIIVVLSFIFICYKIRNERKLQRELKFAGLQNFEKGALENLNPELGIDDQAELLPYDKKWEFPIDKLKLGKQLGSGAFGVVMKGEAKGIVDEESSTTVAVKMVKRNADNTYIKALASELKIMVHLGKHLNVVNLLGACTKNVAKKELLVIVEYCRFGNLQNYLFRHRENFIDQVDPKTCHIDFNIGQDILERTYSVSSSRSNPQSPYLKYAALTFANSNNKVPEDRMDYRGNNYSGATTRTDTTIVTDDEGVVLSNNSVQPEWRSNYRGDYKGNVRPISTKDLLAWAFQVSRGMEYLASRKVLHGDLAARNILLSENNVVKICDFGLAKSMYKNDNYKKKGDGPLPVKWMAIESIRDRIFSTQSDVWSFGIVLWEFFSLARTPYPGMEADERLFNKLLDGYRMESPEYCPREIYKMMLDCWQPKPVMRPSFTKLAERIGSMLEDCVRKHYIDLNDPYLVMNTQRLEDGRSDYLAMLSPPTFENLCTPHQYVNESKGGEETPGYLCMKPTIFSPRVEDDRVFDFNVPKTKNSKDSTVEGNKNELIPMLSGVNRSSESSDCESACNSPNSFSNPSYHLPPIVESDKQSDQDIVKSTDNYVNMPQNKFKEKNSNPFVNMDKDSKNVLYVNTPNSRNWGSVNG